MQPTKSLNSVKPHDLGREGEAEAERYLRSHGYSILARNHRHKQGELDLIAKSTQGELVFIEVKAGRAQHFGSPAERVHGLKQYRLQRLAETYVHEHGLHDSPMRFDVIAVNFTQEASTLEHFENAFLPSRNGYRIG